MSWCNALLIVTSLSIAGCPYRRWYWDRDTTIIHTLYNVWSMYMYTVHMDHTLYTVQCMVCTMYGQCTLYTVHTDHTLYTVQLWSMYMYIDHTLYTVQCMDIKSTFGNNYCRKCSWCYAIIIAMYVVCKSIILPPSLPPSLPLSLSLFYHLSLFSFSFIVDQINAKLR